MAGRSFSRRIQLARSIHRLAERVLFHAGYRLEIRSVEGTKLGLWRHRLTRRADGPNPSRLVLIPGFGDTPLTWLPVLTGLRLVLQRSFDELILFDLPGFSGALSQERCFTSMDQLLSASGDVLEQLKPDSLIGHSLGGWMAADYLTRAGMGMRAHSPRQGILISPSGAFGEPAEALAFRDLFNRAMIEGLAPLHSHIFSKPPIGFALIREYFEQFITREDTIEFMKSVREDHELESRLKHIQSEMWLLWGELDTLCRVKWADCWLANLTGEAKVIYLRKTGHSPHVERPWITGAVLGQVLSGRVPHLLGKRWWRVQAGVQAKGEPSCAI